MQVKVYLDPGLEKEFRELVKMKYDTFHGAVSQEVSDALGHWINLHKQSLDAHTKMHTKLNPRTPKLHAWLREIIRELGPAVHQASRQDLERAISRTRGSDDRTIDKWIGLLVKNGYLKVLNFWVFEVL